VILAEMQSYNISADQATSSVLIDLISSESAQGRARASDVWWILDHGGGPHGAALAPRVWVPLMKILATAAKKGHASSEDALLLTEMANKFFGRRGGVPSVFFFNSAMLVLVNEARFLTGGKPPGMRLKKNRAESDGSSSSSSSSSSSKSPWSILELMDSVGEAPDVITFNTALSAYVTCAVGETRDMARQQGLALIAEMRRRQISATTGTYNTLIQILAYTLLDGAPPDKALAHAFSSASSTAYANYNIASSSSLPVSPERAAITVGALTPSQRATNAVLEVDTMMIRMRRENVMPDSMTYDTLFNVITAACKLSVVVSGSDVERWLVEMEAEGARATRNTWLSITAMLPLLAAAGNISAAQARQIMCRLTALGSAPSLQGYNLLLTTIARACRHNLGALSDAGLVLQSMEDAKIAVNCFTFNALFDVLAASAESPLSEVTVNDVFQMTKRMQDENVHADTVTLNSALSVFLSLARANPPRASAQDAHTQIRVFEDRMGVAPDVISYTKLLEIVAADAGNGLASLLDAHRILEQMQKKGITPSRISWNVVMSVVAHAAVFEPCAMTQVERECGCGRLS